MRELLQQQVHRRTVKLTKRLYTTIAIVKETHPTNPFHTFDGSTNAQPLLPPPSWLDMNNPSYCHSLPHLEVGNVLVPQHVLNAPPAVVLWAAGGNQRLVRYIAAGG